MKRSIALALAMSLFPLAGYAQTTPAPLPTVAPAPTSPEKAAAKAQLADMRREYIVARREFRAVRNPYFAKQTALKAASDAKNAELEKTLTAELATMKPTYVAAREKFAPIKARWNALKAQIAAKP